MLIQYGVKTSRERLSNHDYKIIQLPTFSRGSFVGLFQLHFHSALSEFYFYHLNYTLKNLIMF